MPIKVALTDDHPMVLSGLKSALEENKDILITGAYSSGYDLLEALKINQPDVLLLDIHLPHMNGEKIAQQVLRDYPAIKILILSAQEESFLIQDMLTLGCSGYLLKSSTDHDILIDAIESVYSGAIFLEPELRKILMADVCKMQKKSTKAAALLTKKEKEILHYVIEGLSSKKIADVLCISIRTVETHRFSLLQKMDVKNTAELVRKALELHLVH